MTPVPVPPEDLARWCDRLEWHFQSFCRDGSTTPGRLWAEISEKQRQLWVAADGEAVKAAVLTMVKDDLHQTFIVTHAAGEERGLWVRFWAYLEDFARGIGCKSIVAEARPGWERDLRRFGMKKTHIIMEKAL